MKFRVATRTFELTVKKSATYTVRRARRVVLEWCDRCQREVRMSQPEEAAEICGRSVRQVYADIEAGAVHFLELPDGSVFVCLISLDGGARAPQSVKGELDQP